MLVQAGKRYQRRDGSVMKKPLEKHPISGETYKFLDMETGLYITVKGRVFLSWEDKSDLIEEVNEAPDAVEHDCDGTEIVK